jgi:hypothetical protein
MTLKPNQLLKIEETLKDFVCLTSRYLEVRNNEELLDMFLNRNRNPLFDLTGTNYWNTGLSSNDAKNKKGKIVKDHYVPRKIAMGYIMNVLVDNPNMSVDEFTLLCKKYASTIKLTKDEHTRVTSAAKNSGRCNYEFYESCGVIIEGIEGLISKLSD